LENANEELSAEVNAGETKYIFMSHACQNAPKSEYKDSYCLKMWQSASISV
jgi:hypothetical protein